MKKLGGRVVLARHLAERRVAPSGLEQRRLGTIAARARLVAPTLTALTVPHRAFSCTTAPVMQSWSRNNMRRWMCVNKECHGVNTSGATACEKCGTDKPQLRGWKCVLCATRNHSGVKKCKTCEAPAEQSAGFWMCAACGENNRVDDIEDNSRCGFCLYDMAPLSRSEEEILQSAHDRHQRFTEAQASFDSISAEDAERNFGDVLAGASALPAQLTQSIGVAGLATEARPFELTPQSSRRSLLSRRRLLRGDTAPDAGAVPAGPPGFDWMCREVECAHINPGDEEVCEQCKTHITPEDWECHSCAALNHLSRSRCFSCDASIPIFWTCTECGGTTSIYDRECRRCQTPRQAVEPRNPSARDKATEVPGGPGALRKRRGDWLCSGCNAHNFSRRTDCFQCGAARRSDSGAEGGGRDGTQPGANNWKCEQCSADNFRTRESCWQCKSEAPAWAKGLGTSAAGRPAGGAPRFVKEGFQAGPLSRAARAPSDPLARRSSDWTCAKCYAKNFGRNAECFKCGAPKSSVVPGRRARVRKPVKL